MSRITKLESENVKRIRAVRFEPKPGVNIVRGKNDQGKSSTLDSIEYLFGGAKTHPPEVIRLGEEQARVIGETPEIIATRRWWRTPDGVKTELVVKSKVDGQIIKSPQALLDKLYSPESDPTAFFRMKGAERLDWLKKIVGVDTSMLDRQRQKIFEARTLVNHDLAAAQARLKAMLGDKPPPAVDTTALLKTRGDLTNAEQWARQTKSERDAAMRRISDCQEAVKVAEQALTQAKVRLETATKQAAQADNAADEADDAAAGATEKLAEIDQQLQKASAIATANARWAEREGLVVEVKRLVDLSGAKTTEIDQLKKQAEDMIAGAKFPIDGLGFGDGDVTFKGLPLEQASGAQRIRIGAAVLVARNPKLRVMRVPDGEKLDEDNLGALEALCEENDWQCFVEAVGESGPATIVIRDGEVLS